jgi:hypothetical protein
VKSNMSLSNGPLTATPTPVHLTKTCMSSTETDNEMKGRCCNLRVRPSSTCLPKAGMEGNDKEPLLAKLKSNSCGLEDVDRGLPTLRVIVTKMEDEVD